MDAVTDPTRKLPAVNRNSGSASRFGKIVPLSTSSCVIFWSLLEQHAAELAEILNARAGAHQALEARVRELEGAMAELEKGELVGMKPESLDAIREMERIDRAAELEKG